MPIGTLTKNTARQSKTRGEQAAEQHAGRDAHAGDRAPDGERGGALATGVGRHHDRHRCGGQQRSAGALRGAGEHRVSAESARPLTSEAMREHDQAR